MPDFEIERFGKTTRWVHWTFGLSFLTLAATGALLLGREALGLSATGVGRLVVLHKLAVGALLVLPAVVWLSGETHRTWKDFRHLGSWSRDDWRWLALQPRAALGGAVLPDAHKLNAGQKLNGWLTIGLTTGQLLSGLVLWLEPGAFGAWVVHLALFFAWLPIFVGHLFLALIHPQTRPALRGMVLGRVSRSWAEHHHAAWIRSLVAGESVAGGGEPRRSRSEPTPVGRAAFAARRPEEELLDPAVGLADGSS